MTIERHSFETGAALAAALAETIATVLSEAIAARGRAVIAVSGGSTPKALFKALSVKESDWAQVHVTLVDERFVPSDNPRSNHLLVKDNLLQGKAAAAQFLPLYHAVGSIGEAAEIATGEAAALGAPFDVAILGMGNDGHTASFFPGGDRLAEALDLAAPRRVMTMEAADAGEPRLTFSFASLHDARLLVLHIEGAEKQTVLEKALAGGAEEEMPIRAVLNRAASPVAIYWAP